MNYIETPTFFDVLKLQIMGVRQLDIKTIKRLLPYLEKAELNLRRELDKYSSEQFSYKKRIQTLSVINKTISEMEKILLTEYERSNEEYFNFGREMAEKEITSFNKLKAIETPDIKKQQLSVEQNKFLINNAEASLKTYTSRVRQTVSDALTMGTLSGKTGYEIVSNLKRFMDIKKWRFQRIVRTESHKIFNSAKLLSYGEFKKEHFPDLKKRLVHFYDSRTGKDSIQLAKKDPIIDIDKPFVFIYKRRLKDGQVRITKRVFMVPPDRPNDRASCVPFRKEWENV